MDINEAVFENRENDKEDKLLPEVMFTQLQDTAREWARIQLIYESALKQVNTKIEILNNEFTMAHKYNPIEHVTSRIKSPESIAKKLRHNDLEVTMENIVNCLNDVAGIRIICSFTSDIYRIAELISGQSDVTVIKVKDYIANPKPNGYKSYHLIVSVPVFLSEAVVDAKVEIQIRTIAMDFWASLEHKMYYKFEGNAPANIRRELKECADLVSFLDAKMLAINEEIKEYTDESGEENTFFTGELFKEVEPETVKNVEDSKNPEPAGETAEVQAVEVTDEYWREVEEDDSDMITRLKSVFTGKTGVKA